MVCHKQIILFDKELYQNRVEIFNQKSLKGHLGSAIKIIVSWCNGSTSLFDSDCLGSNPEETTIFHLKKENYYDPQYYFRSSWSV